MFSNFDISADCVLLLFSNSINATRMQYLAIKESNLWPSHWGHFDTITSITRPPCLSEAIWHDKWAVCWLRWALCVCVAVCTDWPVRGEGGPVSKRRTTVHRCPSTSGPARTHTHANTHMQTHTHTRTSGDNPALLFIFQKLFCDKCTNSNLCVVFLCTCVASIFLFTLRSDLCTPPPPPCGLLCIAFVCFHSRYMFILLWSACTPLVRADSCDAPFQTLPILPQAKAANPSKIVSLCFSRGYLAALQLDSMLCISEDCLWYSFEGERVLYTASKEMLPRVWLQACMKKALCHLGHQGAHTNTEVVPCVATREQKWSFHVAVTHLRLAPFAEDI